jgi:hypothetical protein
MREFHYLNTIFKQPATCINASTMPLVLYCKYRFWLNNGGGGPYIETEGVFVGMSAQGNPIFSIGPYNLRSSLLELTPRSRGEEFWEIEEA